MSQQFQATDKPIRHDGQAAAGQAQANELNEPIPHVGQPLDGRHYLDVLEEQAHADTKPDLDGENPRHPDTDQKQGKSDSTP